MQTFTLSGLTCPACKKIVEKRMAAISGVKSVEVDFKSGETVIQADRDIQLLEVREVLKDTSYQVIK